MFQRSCRSVYYRRSILPLLIYGRVLGVVVVGVSDILLNKARGNFQTVP